jgi:hypothetical protein
MDAFDTILVGTISTVYGTSIATNDGVPLTFDKTNVENTVLYDTVEMAFLREYGTSLDSRHPANYTPFQVAVEQSADLWPGISIPQNATASKLQLKDALETLFQNITIVLMSSASLQ